MDQIAVTMKGACAELETVFLVNIWPATALNPSFSVAKACHPPPQRAEDFQRRNTQHVKSCRLHYEGMVCCWEGDVVPFCDLLSWENMAVD